MKINVADVFRMSYFFSSKGCNCIPPCSDCKIYESTDSPQASVDLCLKAFQCIETIKLTVIVLK